MHDRRHFRADLTRQIADRSEPCCEPISGPRVQCHTPCCGLIEGERINSMFAPPTVWISFLRHQAFAERDLASLEKVQYGASIMPVPVLRELRDRLPNPRFYNCYGPRSRPAVGS